MKFEKYRLSEAECGHMWRCITPGKDKTLTFHLPLIRNADNQQTHYDGIEFPPKHQDLRNYLRLKHIVQYKNLPQKGEKKEQEIFFFFVFPRAVMIYWADDTGYEIPGYTYPLEIP